MGGVSSGCDSASCLPTGGINGRPSRIEIKTLINEHEHLSATKKSRMTWKGKLDPDRGRSWEEEGPDMDGNHGQKEDKIKPETGKSKPVGGVSSCCGSASCLPTWVIDGRTHISSDTTPANRVARPVTLRLSRPKSFKGDGRSFMRYCPMSARIRLEDQEATEIYAMTDVCSNTGLIDLNILKEKYPEAKINPRTANITGVGSQSTVG